MVAPVKRALLYTIEGNADGEAALAYLQARGVAVDLFDVGKDPDASLALFTRLGRLGVPTIVIEDRAFVGFEAHRQEIDALVRE
jgi:glutaredoxin